MASYVLLHTETRNPAPIERPVTTDALGWCGSGWTLLTYVGGAICESVRLQERGAAHDCAPRVAQAVAVRVLAEQGLEVTGWDPPGGSVSFVATVSAGHPDPPRPGARPRPRPRVLVRASSSSEEPPEEPPEEPTEEPAP